MSKATHKETLVAYCPYCTMAHSTDEVYYEMQPKDTVSVCPCCNRPFSKDEPRRRVMFCKRTEMTITSNYWFMPPIVCEDVPGEPQPLWQVEGTEEPLPEQERENLRLFPETIGEVQ